MERRPPNANRANNAEAPDSECQRIPGVRSLAITAGPLQYQQENHPRRHGYACLGSRIRFSFAYSHSTRRETICRRMGNSCLDRSANPPDECIPASGLVRLIPVSLTATSARTASNGQAVAGHETEWPSPGTHRRRGIAPCMPGRLGWRDAREAASGR